MSVALISSANVGAIAVTRSVTSPDSTREAPKARCVVRHKSGSASKTLCSHTGDPVRTHPRHDVPEHDHEQRERDADDARRRDRSLKDRGEQAGVHAQDQRHDAEDNGFISLSESLELFAARDLGGAFRKNHRPTRCARSVGEKQNPSQITTERIGTRNAASHRGAGSALSGTSNGSSAPAGSVTSDGRRV